MKFLIDTQAFIWFVENNKNLPTKIKRELENPENLIIVSIASLWEMTIKMSLGKLILNCEIDDMIEKVYANGFEILPILPEHIIKLSTLDSIHRDPFDRIIISQALTENIVLVSSDDIFDNYPKLKRVWK